MQGNQRPGVHKQLPESPWIARVTNKPYGRYRIILFVSLLITGAYVSSLVLETSVNINMAFRIRPIEFPLNCSFGNLTRTCPTNYYPPNFQRIDQEPLSAASTCPHYFHWIHEDLRPWRETGITREMVERANMTANFRLVILNGRAYVETYEKAFQTRDTFTLWGILQLLRRYPGKVPDLDMMFDCVDWPVVRSSDYQGPTATTPPPLFRYCGDHETLDIVFPDWSFWGWPEINIKPWELLRGELSEGNKRVSWNDREPYAFWKGNPNVAEKRMDLLKCNVTEKQDWNARVYAQPGIFSKVGHRHNKRKGVIFPQEWLASIKFSESANGFLQIDRTGAKNHSKATSNQTWLINASIGSAWSVSEKYILACDSVSLLVKPRYYDFFTRSLMPLHHYWPIREEEKCRDIKFAVVWGNSHKRKAKAIGKAASTFVIEDLRMDYVYDYMFHLLNEYAKLLNYKPTIPQQAVELCSEAMACPAEGREKKFMIYSMAKGPAYASPCTLPPPFDAFALASFLRRKTDAIKNVELLEHKYWEGQDTQT